MMYQFYGTVKKTILFDKSLPFPMERKIQSPSSETIHFTQHQITIIKTWAEQPSISHTAHKLNLSEHTVQTHLKRMRHKLNVSRTFDVFRYMQKQKLL